MRSTLEEAVRHELRRVHDETSGAAPWPAHPVTLAALVRRGLLAHSTRKSKRGHRLDAWAITEHGRDVLAPRERFRRETLVYLRRPASENHGDFTTDRSYAIDDAPVIDTSTLDHAWTQLAEERRAAAEDRRARARRARRNLLASASR